MHKNLFAKTTASVAAFAVAMSCGWFTLSHFTAGASEKPRPDVNVDMTKIMDGTGWNGDTNNNGVPDANESWTPAPGVHTFINRTNGFTVGDNTPTDGVVASGDTVQYKLKLNFIAGQKRTVNVRINLDDAPSLELQRLGSYCVSESNVKASFDESTGVCKYEIPAGSTATFTQPVYLKAKDTKGTISRNNRVSVNVARENGSDFNISLDQPITVVSAPSSDLYLDNGSDPHNRVISERAVALEKDVHEVSGVFNVKRAPLKYRGWSNLGATNGGVWTSPSRPFRLDVSAWPKNAKFYFENRQVGVGGNIITVTPEKSYDSTAKISWKIDGIDYRCKEPASPHADTYDCTVSGLQGGLDVLNHNSREAVFPIHLMVDKTAFATGSNDDMMLNGGKGGEPGYDKGKYESTADEQTGAMSGGAYANNSWSRGIIVRDDPRYFGRCEDDRKGNCYMFTTMVNRPYVDGKTIFDDESRTWTEATGERTVGSLSWGASGSKKVAENTIMRHQLMAMLKQRKMPTEKLEVEDSWDNSQQQYIDSSLQVYYSKSNTEMYYNRNNAIKGKLMPDTSYHTRWKVDNKWQDNQPSDLTKLQGIKVELPDSDYQVGEGYYVTYKTRALNSTTAACTTAIGREGGDKASGSADNMQACYHIAKVGTPTASINNTIKVTRNNKPVSQNETRPGDIVHYTITPSYGNIAYSQSRINKIKVNVSGITKGAFTFNSLDSSAWKADFKNDSKGRLQSIVFTPNGNKNENVRPSLDEDGNGDLPPIEWSARVTNLAIGRISTSAKYEYTVEKIGTSYKHENVLSNSAMDSAIVSSSDSNTGSITPDGSAEINDILNYRFNITARGSSYNGVNSMSTIITLPTESSANSKIKLVPNSVKIAEANSTRVKIEYSNSKTGGWREWNKSWEDISQKFGDVDPDRVNTFKYVRVTTYFEPYGDDQIPVAAAEGKISLVPVYFDCVSGGGKHNLSRREYNMTHRDEKYTVHMGSNMVDGNPRNSEPGDATHTIVASRVKGAVWDDKNGDAMWNEREKPASTPTREKGWNKAKVELVDVNNNNKVIKSLRTNSDGEYEFPEVHSGNMIVRVVRSNSSVPQATKAKNDYYNMSRNIINTVAYNVSGCTNGKQVYDSDCKLASNDSATVNVPFNNTRKNVDFGYYTPKPLVSLKKTLTNKSCTGTTCRLQYAVTVSNDGDTPVSGGKIVDRMSKNVRDVHAYLSRFVKGSARVFTDSDHSLVLSSGRVYAWGYNQYGQSAGHVQTSEDFSRIRSMDPVHPSNTAVSIPGVCTSADTGSMHSVAICGGVVYSWGLNDKGQLGRNTNEPALGVLPNSNPEPKPVEGLAGKGTPMVVAAGADTTEVIMNNGTMWRTTKTPGTWTQVDGTYKTTQGALSHFATVLAAIKSDGTAVHTIDAWSDGKWDFTNLEGNNYTQVAAGYNHVLGLRSDGTISTWGVNNDFGQLAKPTDNGYVSVSAGYMNSGAVKSDGSVYTWGLDLYGGLAQGNKVTGTAYHEGKPAGTRIMTPTLSKMTVNANGANKANLIAMGFNHSLFAGGEVKVAGFDAYGDGTNARKHLDYTVYEVGETKPESLGQVKLYGSDYVDVDSMRPVNYDSETPVGSDTNPFIERTISVGNLPAKSTTTLVVEGIVDRNPAVKNNSGSYTTGADKFILNQAYYTSPATPYSKTPKLRELGYSEPNLPQNNADKLIANASCRITDGGFKLNDTTNGEDMCGETVTKVAGLQHGVLYGTINGRMWFDKNHDGKREDDESKRFEGKTVSLWEWNQQTGKLGNKISETTTNKNGEYTFDKLPIDGGACQSTGNDQNLTNCDSKTYRVMFQPMTGFGFTTPNVANNGTYGSEQSTDVVNDSDVDDNSKSPTFGLSYPISWTGVSSDQKLNGVDAGYYDSTLKAFPITGNRMIVLIAIGIAISIAMTVIWQLVENRCNKGKEILGKQEVPQA